jgi:lipoyl-dependent peroxiredoxin
MTEDRTAAIGAVYEGGEFQPLYTAKVEVESGGMGHARMSGRATSDDQALDVKLAMPKALGGPGGDGTNPEQLFAAGYAACFQGAMAVVAGTIGVKLGRTQISSQVTIGRDPSDGGYALEVELGVDCPDLPVETARTLVEQAHNVCPYSKAVKGNIAVHFTRISGNDG